MVDPFDHKYVYGPTPPPVTATVAVPLVNEGHVASVDDVDTVKAHGAEHATDGWKPYVPRPKVVSTFASVPDVSIGI